MHLLHSFQSQNVQDSNPLFGIPPPLVVSAVLFLARRFMSFPVTFQRICRPPNQG